MRKTLALLLLVLSAASLSAAVIVPSSSNEYKHVLDPVTVTSPRMQAMGGAGLALTEGPDSVFTNPAGLAGHDFELALPYVSVTLYNPLNLYKSGLVDAILDGEDYVSTAMDFLDSLGVYNKLLRVDAGLALTFKGFGFGVAVQDTVHTYSLGLSGSASIINQLVVKATAGYGLRLILPHRLSLDIGASVSFNYLAYTEAVGAEEILDNFDDLLDYLASGLPIMAGYSVPFTVGLTLNTPVGISASAVLSNINGRYNMRAYEGYEDFVDEVVSFDFLNGGQFSLDTDMDFSMGLAWSADWPFVEPAVAVDLVDIVGLIDNDTTFRDILGHLRIGAELKLLTIVSIRAGIMEGYFSLGAGLDLRLFEVDVAYFNEEYGSAYGTKPVDGLTVRFRLGW